ncbi:MAG TPA: Mur ligase family protein [Candidatus Saccharimonadales bacterium]|jgi:dihydrofolate synthase/folylpolyglutamate synthase|nr:Mur ligase family protein [Candidatus Saccharimonadales bacterium]
MKRIASLAAAPGVLEAYWPNRSTLHRMSLDYMRDLLDYLGNPQDKVRVIHVAGTSGKTSTAYYIAALLTAGGKKTGLTVSPHVDLLNERVQINMVPLPENAFVRALNEFMARVEEGGFTPTYFELLYAFAFWEFARQKVDYAVIEVGVGGLLDNTNVISRSDKVCVLTDIGFDHMSVLGYTLPEIAAQKAGIIQLHNAVFCWRQGKDVMDMFTAAVRQQQADLHILDKPQLGADCDFLPLFQRRNFELALHAAKFVLQRDGDRLPARQAMVLAAHTLVPARMEVRSIQGKTVILDGSHNPQKLHALVESIQGQFPGQPVAVLVGFAKSKTPENRIGAGTHELLQLAAHLIITSFVINRNEPHYSIDPQAMATACDAERYTAYEIIKEPAVAFQALIKRPEPVVVVAGSFYLLNTIRPLLAVD